MIGTRSRRRLIGLSLIAGSAGLMLAPAALADSQTPANSPIVVRRVDSTDTTAVKVAFTCECTAKDVDSITVTENDKKAKSSTPARVSTLGGSATVLVIDASETTSTGILADFKVAAKAFVDNRAGNDVVAVVSATQSGSVRAPFSADSAALDGGDRPDRRRQQGRALRRRRPRRRSCSAIARRVSRTS